METLGVLVLYGIGIFIVIPAIMILIYKILNFFFGEKE